MADMINVGGIMADLQLDSGNLERGLANARRAMQTAEAEMNRLDDAMRNNAIARPDYVARIRELGATIRDLGTATQAAYAHLGTTGNAFAVYNAGVNRATNGTGALAQGLMQVGYIADDIQYGFHGIVNNISPLVYSFSAASGASTAMASGIAAGVQIATVAAYQLYVHWSDVEDLFGVGGTRTEAEEMEALANATHRTAEEQKILNKYKKEQRELEKLQDTPDKDTRESEKASKKAIEDLGFNNLKVGIMKTFVGEGTNSKPTPDEQAEIGRLTDRINANLNPEMKQARVNERDEEQERLNKKLSDEDARRADKMLTHAMEDDETPQSKNPGRWRPSATA